MSCPDPDPEAPLRELRKRAAELGYRIVPLASREDIVVDLQEQLSPLPGQLWIARIGRSETLAILDSEEKATIWWDANQAKGNLIRMWNVAVSDPVEMEYVRPKPAFIRQKD